MTTCRRHLLALSIGLLGAVGAVLQTQPAPHEGPIDTVRLVRLEWLS